MTTCYRHPSRETAVSCSSCGRPICPDCMTPTPVGMRCPECSRQRTRVARMRDSAAQPTLTYALIAINTIIEIASSLGGSQAIGGSLGGNIDRYGGLDAPDIANGDYWRLITSGFLHAGFLHLAFNMVALFFLGSLLERAVGKWRFALIYFVSLLTGSLGALIATPNALTVGASGAIFGLLGAAFVLARSRGATALQANLLVWIVINLVFSLTAPGISLGGHIGGLIGGGVTALVLFELPARARVPVPATAALAVAVGAASVVASIAVAGG